MNWLVKNLTATLFVLGGTAAALSAPAGSAVGVDPAAEINSTGALRTLVVGEDVFLGDLIRTSTGGSAQILFEDGTKLVVGPGSALTIEDYLLRADGSAGKMAINALAGTFRFATGNAAKDRYSIKTPSGTIGVPLRRGRPVLQRHHRHPRHGVRLRRRRAKVDPRPYVLRRRETLRHDRRMF